MGSFRRSVLFLLLASALVLTSCTAATPTTAGATPTTAPTSAPKEKIKLKVLSNNNDANRIAILKEIADKSVTELPDFIVETEGGGGGTDYLNKLKTYNAAGEMPDVWICYGPVMDPIIEAGNALDLESYITADKFLENFKDPTMLPRGKDGKMYSLDGGYDSSFNTRIFYNKDLFDKNSVTVPKTWDEFLAACKTLKAAGIAPISFYGKNAWEVTYDLVPNLIIAADPAVYEALLAGKGDWSDPACVGAFDKVAELAKSGYLIPGISSTEYGQGLEMFKSKKAAMYLDFTWAMGDINAMTDVDVMAFPQVNPAVNTADLSIFWGGGPNNGWHVSAKSKDLEAAVKLAEFCCQIDTEYLVTNLKCVANLKTKAVIENITAVQQKAIDMFDTAKTKRGTLPNFSYSTQSLSEFSTLASKLLTGEYTGTEFAKDFAPIWADNAK